MQIIDLHAHLRRDYKTKKYYTEEFLCDMEENKIKWRMVSAVEGRSIAHQNAFVEQFVKEHSNKLLACAVLNPKEDDALAEAERIATSGTFRAVELDSLEHGYIPETCPNIDEIFELCEASGIFVKCFTGWGDHTMPGQWEYYVKRHPKVKTVFLHMGGFWDGYNCVDIAKKYENVYVDTSDVYEIPQMKYALKELSHSRILFGSMYPKKLTQWSLEFYDAVGISTEDKRRFYEENAMELLGFEA